MVVGHLAGSTSSAARMVAWIITVLSDEASSPTMHDCPERVYMKSTFVSLFGSRRANCSLACEVALNDE